MAKAQNPKTGKHPGGRPTKYIPQYCESARSAGRKGWGVAQLAHHLKVNKSTITEWVNTYEEFSVALEDMKASRESWLLAQATRMIKGGKGNDRLLMFLLNCTHGYRPGQETEITGKSVVEVSFDDVQSPPSTT
jgi:transposase-like protein